MRVYHGNIEARSGTNWTVELWNGPTPVTPDTSIELCLTGCSFERQGEGDRYYENNVRPSRAVVGFTANKVSTGTPDSSVQANLQNIALDEEQKWAIVVYKGGSLYWVGRVLADQIQYRRTSEHTFICEVTAVDALNLMDDYDVDPTWFTSGKITAMQLLVKCLEQANLYQYWNTAGVSTYINDAIENTNAAVTLSQKLAFMRLNELAFIEGQDIFSRDIKYKSCKDALESILTMFCARLFHDNGVYWIAQANSYDGTVLTFDQYNTSGVLHAADQTITHRISVGSNTRPAWEAKPVISYQQPVREVLTNFRAVNGVYGKKTTFNSSDLSISGNIPSNLALKAQFIFDSETQPSSNYDRLVFNFRVYVRNPTSGVYYRYDSNSGTWYNIGTSAPGNLYYEFLIQDKRINGVFERVQVITYEMPAPPAGATEIYADGKVTWQRMGTKAKWSILGSKTTRTWSTATTAAASWKGTVVISSAYNTSDPFNWEKKGNYSSILSSPRNVNSQKVEIETAFYNGRLNDAGNIELYNGTSYVNPGAWSVGWTANTGDIGQVLARQITGLYSDFLPTIRGTVHDTGNYHAGRTLFFDSGVWVLNGCKFDAQRETWEGEWLRVQQSFTNITDNGEGERIATDSEKIFDRIGALEQSITKQVENWTFLKDRYVDSVFNDSTPIEPTLDKRWNVQLNYTNSNQAIDFLANETFSNAWAEIVKEEKETVNSDTTLSNDSALQFTMLADTVYAVRAYVPMYGTSVTGIKIKTTGPSASDVVERCDISHPGGQLEHYLADALGNQRLNTYSATGVYLIKYDISLTTTTGGIFAIQWAQANSDAADTSVLAGAYLEYKIVKAAPAGALLIETGDYMLLETSDKILKE